LPLVRFDLETGSEQSFKDAMAEFERQVKALPELPPFPFTKGDGWYDITPQMSEAMLIHSVGNRPWRFNNVKAYGRDIAAGDWAKTGESVSCVEQKIDNKIERKVANAHHRAAAGYFSGGVWPCFVVTSVPDQKNLFAYYDSGAKRSNADALSVAGLNGSSKIIAQAISDLAIRYDAGKLGVQKQPRFTPINQRQCLAYLTSNPDLSRAASLMLGEYANAAAVIGSKPAAVFFAWQVIKTHGVAALDEFCGPLASGAMLDEDSPILAARNKLMVVPLDDVKLAHRTRLAYVAKAFLMHIAGQKMGRSRGRVLPLLVALDEPFPRIDAPVESVAA
jgi:hypothetical protein